MDAEEARAEYLVDLVSRYASNESKILEVGCRAGNNLASLWRAGFKNLRGIESDMDALSLFERDHPEVAKSTVLTSGPIPELIRDTDEVAFDLVFTVGFLFDKTGDFTWLFPELARITGRYLIYIEEESAGPVDALIEELNFREVESTDLSKKKGLDSVFRSRVFERLRDS